MNYKIKRKRILEYLIKCSRNCEGMILVSMPRKKIAKKLKISGSSVHRAIRYLQWKGDLRIYKKVGHVNYYRITIGNNIIN